MTPDAIIRLGNIAAAMLLKMGAAAFYLAGDGSVQAANPAHVYFDNKAFGVPDGDVRYVRPVVTDGRPQMVAMKDGEPWEIEVVPKEEADAEDQGSEEPAADRVY